MWRPRRRCRTRARPPAGRQGAARSPALSKSVAIASSSSTATGRSREVAGGDGDLRQRRQHLRPGQPVPARRLERFGDDRRGRVEVALGESQQRDAGPRLGAESSAVAKAAAAPSRSPSRRRMSPISAQAIAALGRLMSASSSLARTASRSASAQSPRHWSAVAWCTRQRPGKTARGWRSAHRAVAVGPLRRPPVIAQLLARADEAAVHLARRIRRQPTLDSEQHRFVEERNPSAARPWSMRMRPSACNASASRSAHRSRRPRSIARSASASAGRDRRCRAPSPPRGAAAAPSSVHSSPLPERPPSPAAAIRRRQTDWPGSNGARRAIRRIARPADPPRARRTTGRPLRGPSMQSSRRPSHHAASASRSSRSASSIPSPTVIAEAASQQPCQSWRAQACLASSRATGAIVRMVADATASRIGRPDHWPPQPWCK